MSEQPRILVIDDEEDVRDTICENLAAAGFDVMEAIDGDQGVLMITDAAQAPAVMITDLLMPKKEGFETILEVRKKFPDMKIIAISGGGRTKNMDFLELAEMLGADAVLPKPVDLDQLEALAKKLTAKHV